MARRPAPWFRKARKSWFVTISGVQHNLGPEKAEAYERFHQLMRQPSPRKAWPESLPAIADAFLDWTHRNRAIAKMTGDSVTHFIIYGGLFEQATNELLHTGFRISWLDRVTPLPVGGESELWVARPNAARPCGSSGINARARRGPSSAA